MQLFRTYPQSNACDKSVYCLSTLLLQAGSGYFLQNKKEYITVYCFCCAFWLIRTIALEQSHQGNYSLCPFRPPTIYSRVTIQALFKQRSKHQTSFNQVDCYRRESVHNGAAKVNWNVSMQLTQCRCDIFYDVLLLYNTILPCCNTTDATFKKLLWHGFHLLQRTRVQTELKRSSVCVCVI